MARVCNDAKAAGSEDPFYDTKLQLADVFFAEILPDNVGLAAKVQAGHKHLMQFPEAML